MDILVAHTYVYDDAAGSEFSEKKTLLTQYALLCTSAKFDSEESLFQCKHNTSVFLSDLSGKGISSQPSVKVTTF
jgi:hypothetical protein